MKMKFRLFEIITLLVILASVFGLAQEARSEDAKFVSIPLGVKGGLREDNLSSYLLAPKGSTDFIALDAGTLLAGLRQARIMESFQDIRVPVDSELILEGWVLQHHIKAYLISHAHIDHVAGLVLNAPDDNSKEILGIDSTIDYIRDYLFNWKIWPNFGDEGEGFQLKKYHYVRLTPGEEHQIAETSMSVVPFVLSHSNGYPSTAFLIHSDGNYVVYFGDTGADELEKADKVQQVWTYIAPLVRDKKLRGIFLEVSYPNEVPDDSLFGHLTPKWMMTELHNLAKLVSPEQPDDALTGLKVVVTHIKPSLKQELPRTEIIKKQLEEMNDLGVKFIIPEQGGRIEF